MNATEAWSEWRSTRIEGDQRDIPAMEAFRAGYEAHKPDEPTPWHQSLMTVLIVAVIAAAVCYVLAGTPH